MMVIRAEHLNCIRDIIDNAGDWVVKKCVMIAKPLCLFD